MNIQISRIVNGWLVVVQTSQGSSPFYYATYQEVVTEVTAILAEAEAASKKVSPLSPGPTRKA